MVQQSVSNEIGVKTYEQTYNYAVNKSIETMVKYLNQRGLDVSKLADQRELLERGIYAWMAGRHIKKIKIEMPLHPIIRAFESVDSGKTAVFARLFRKVFQQFPFRFSNLCLHVISNTVKIETAASQCKSEVVTITPVMFRNTFRNQGMPMQIAPVTM